MKITDLQGYKVVSPAKTVTPSQEQVTASQDTDGFALDLAQGVAKSAGDIGLGLGTLGRKVQGGISKAIGAVTGIENFGMGKAGLFDPGSEQNITAKETLARDTAGEKVGGFIGDVASFALPGGAVTKASKGANLLTRAGALGASDAVTTTIRQGEFDRDSVDAAIIGAAFPIVGKGASVAKTTLLPSGKDAGGRVINSLVKPLLKDFSYGKDPGKAVAEAGIVANSLDDLAIKIREVRQATGSQIGEAVARDNGVYNAKTAFASIDNAIAEAQKSPRTNAAIINRLQNLKDDLLQVGEDGLPTRNLENLSAEDLFALKRDVGDLTRWTGNASDDEIVNKALKQTYGSLKGQLDDNVVGVKELNEKYANLLSAENATVYRDKIASRQNLISLSGTQLGTAAAITSAIVSGGAVIPILIGASTGAATEALKSPAVKTRVAAWLATASQKEIQDAFYQAPWLRGAIQTSLLGEDIGEDEPSN